MMRVSTTLRGDIDEQVWADAAPTRGGAGALRFDGVDACASVDALRAWLQRFARRVGFYAGRYVHLGHGQAVAGAQPARPARCLSTVAREGAQCDAAGWTLFDPARDRVPTGSAPFTWSTRLTPGLTDRQRTWINGERARGVAAGIAVPVQDHAAGPAYLSLFGTDEAEAQRLLAEHGRELTYTAAHFHALAKRLVTNGRADQGHSALTAREVECLRRAALGDTVGETARAIGITERTIEFHLANAVSKVGALNKTHAVALAVGQRLISI